MPMDDDTADRLEIEKVAARRDQLPDGVDFHCMGPGCSNVLRKPRMITVGTTVRCRMKGGEHSDDVVPLRRVYWLWCSQACFDAWNDQWKGRIPGTHWPVYDADHQLIAYVVPGRGRVTVDEIEAARQGAQA